MHVVSVDSDWDAPPRVLDGCGVDQCGNVMDMLTMVDAMRSRRVGLFRR